MESVGGGERENYFTPARPGYRHMAAASEAAWRSVYQASIFWPAMAFLSMVQI